jgi:ADP-ribosyl-[dinitrogen reductase] hydrolase
VDEIPVRNDWPRGSTSDDTAQLLLVAHHLVATGGQPSAREFLELLARELPQMRGTGPTTSAAVARYQRTGQVHATSGDTNGALMRILPVGWAIPATHAGRRREVVATLTRVTHGAPAALAAACAVAAMASSALEGCPAGDLIQVAFDELERAGREYPEAGVWLENVRAAAGETWRPGEGGVPMDAISTLAAVVHVLAVGGDDPGGGMRYAVSLGGDTDTVAAIIGGLLGCRASDPVVEWESEIVLPEETELDALAAGLREVRRAAYA